jgi:hypothetical protein
MPCPFVFPPAFRPSLGSDVVPQIGHIFAMGRHPEIRHFVNRELMVDEFFLDL